MKKNRNWWFIGGGLVVAVTGILLAFLGNSIKNSALIVVGAVILIGGGWLIRLGWQNVSYSSKDKTENKVNCFNIYHDKVAFEYCANPVGEVHKYTNTGEDMYIQIFDNEFKEFLLPDGDTGITPKECANPAEMKAVREYFSYMPTTPMKMVTAGILAVIIGAEIIAMIAMTGS